MHCPTLAKYMKIKKGSLVPEMLLLHQKSSAKDYSSIYEDTHG